jgi:ATP-dependent DNA helicase RecQ
LLRAKRKQLADADSVPPYIIFSDRTLVEMSAYYPQSRASLLEISGIGQVKLEKFGDIFLEVIKPYCQQHNLSEIASKTARKIEYAIGTRTRLIGEAYNKGASLAHLIEQYQVKVATIIDHLTKYAVAGNKLQNREDFLPLTASLEDQQAALAAFEELGAEYLKPVFDKLGERVSYEDLRCLRLLYFAC